MTDTYSGTLRVKEKGTPMVRKKHKGVLTIEDDGIVFLFDNGNTTDIKFEEINTIEMMREGFVKTLLINLKDKRKFIFCVMHSNWATIKSLTRMQKGNKEVFNTLNYLIKKNENLKKEKENEERKAKNGK